MADQKPSLTPEQKTKVADRLNTLWTGSARNCPVCGSNQWTIADHVVTPITIGGDGGLQIGGLSYPQVMLISNNCGYTLYFNAILLGVLPAATPPAPEAKDGKP